jgi:hypothetical protein
MISIVHTRDMYHQMCMRGAPSLVLNRAMIVDQLAKHTPLQHRLDNSVDRVAEVFHNG